MTGVPKLNYQDLYDRIRSNPIHAQARKAVHDIAIQMSKDRQKHETIAVRGFLRFHRYYQRCEADLFDFVQIIHPIAGDMADRRTELLSMQCQSCNSETVIFGVEEQAVQNEFTGQHDITFRRHYQVFYHPDVIGYFNPNDDLITEIWTTCPLCERQTDDLDFHDMPDGDRVLCCFDCYDSAYHFYGMME